MKTPKSALSVITTLQGAGFQAYFAGGCVRDMILGREPNDFDIATDATPDTVKSLFSRAVLVGEAFGVIRVLVPGEEGDDEYEVATFRSDGQYSDGRRPDSVRFGSLDEDVRRRDFTMNALMFDPIKGSIIDLVGGQEDIQKRRICAVGDPSLRFAEDSLRMLRAIRLEAQLADFGFMLSPATEDAIRVMALNMNGVSRERVTQELSKIWQSPGPGGAIKKLFDTGLSYVTFYGVSSTANRQPRIYDGLGYSSLTGEDREVLGWALLFHDSATPVSAVHMNFKSFEEMLRKNYRMSYGLMKRIIDLHQMKDRLYGPTLKHDALLVKKLLSPDRELYLEFQRRMLGKDDRVVKETLAFVQSLDEDRVAVDQIPKAVDFMESFKGAALGRVLKLAENAILERRASKKEDAITIAREEYERETKAKETGCNA